MELQWHGTNGLDIGGDIVALGTVATGDRTNQHAVFVLEADAQSIELQLAAKLHLAIDAFLDTINEILNVFFAV